MTKETKDSLISKQLFEALAKALEKIEQIKVIEEFAPYEGAFPEPKIIFESKSKMDIEALKQSLDVNFPKIKVDIDINVNFSAALQEGAFCPYLNDNPIIHLYKNNQRFGYIATHRNCSSIQLYLCDENTLINNPKGLFVLFSINDTEKWLSWFDERGILKPRKERDDIKEIVADLKKTWDKWVSSMPKGMTEKKWDELSIDYMGNTETSALHTLFKESIPNKNERIRSLLLWFASGSGPWSGYPSYETVVSDVLLDYKIIELVNAIDLELLTPAVAEGAARLFCSSGFFNKYPRGIKKLPKNLKEALLEHIKQTGNQDKMAKILHTFRKTSTCFIYDILNKILKNNFF